MVAQDGLKGATIRAVAARAGVSIGTVQHYFPSKDDMLRHAYRQVGADIGARAEAQAEQATSAKDAIRRVLLELLPLDERRADAVRVSIAFSARAMHVAELSAELRRDLAELQEALAGAFAEGGAADPRREALLAVAVVGGLSEPLLFGHSGFTA